MTIRIFAAALLTLALFSPEAEAAKKPAGGFDIEHCALFGEPIDQPSGSSITACCYEDGCWICDANWGNCTWDPANGARGPGAGLIDHGPAVLAPTDTSRPARQWLQRLQPAGRAVR